MTSIVEILRAKSKERSDENDRNLLLKDHLRETIHRALQLRDFIKQNESVFNNTPFDDEFFKSLVIACFLHDLGKINWKFQQRLFDKEEKEWDNTKRRDKLHQLYQFFDDYVKIDVSDHEIISLIYSYIFLDNNEWDKKIRTAILLHHYNAFYTNNNINIRRIFDEYGDLEKYVQFLREKETQIRILLKELLDKISEGLPNDNFIRDIFKELENKINNITKIKEMEYCIKEGGLSKKIELFDIEEKGEDSYDFFVFLGCLRRCDHAASGNLDIEDSIDIYNNLKEKIKKKINRQEIWQEKILEKNNSNNMILIAPTGSGKTEFALLWAEKQRKKLIYTLPLRVALNDLYSRFGNDDKGYFDKDSLRILHSTSFIEYLKEEKDGATIDIDEKENSAKSFSSPIILTTPDQALLSSLKYYGFDKLLGVYPLSSIVIDEIQAYKPEMAAVIIKSMDIIKKLQGNILIITATFPPYFNEFMKEFNRIDLGKMQEKDEVKGYKAKRHIIKIIDKSIFKYNNQSSKDTPNEESSKLEIVNLDEIENIISSNKDKNIMIIVNNVSKAIELYKKFEGNVKNNLYLLHSRLIEKEKERRINEIKDKLKDKRISNNERLIIISTQIVEASVDIDFDILITEISPIDSQIQRWGRIWRNRFDANNKELDYEEKDPNIYIFVGENKDKGTKLAALCDTDEERAENKDIDRGTKAIYDEQSLIKTIKVLNKEFKCISEPLDYEKERELIDKVYESDLLKYYEDEIKKNLEWLKYFSAEKRSEAQRIFRTIAGIQVVIPDLMTRSDNDIERAFGEIIKDKNNWKLPWKSESDDSIIKMVKDKVGDNLKIDDECKFEWELKRILYSYSFNLPLFVYHKHKFELTRRENFKGFVVLNITDEVILDSIKEYGVNELKDIDIDIEEIENYGDNII